MVKKAIFSPGQRCGGIYDITDSLESSPLAETYSAIHRVTRAAATITCSRFDHVDGDPPSVEAFRAGATKIQTLALDSVARIYDSGVSDGVYWVASQFLDDSTILELHARKRKEGKSGDWFVVDAACVALSVQSTLSNAWALGVTHGNLRPARIVIRGLPNSCEPHLLDLGFADLFMLNRNAARATPRYRPPEQLEGEPIDARSDIYTLAMCMYHLIAQAPPYADKAPDSTNSTLLDMALRETPTPLPSLVKHCPDFVWSFIAKAIEKDPSRRFASYAEFGATLDELIDRLMGDDKSVDVLAALRMHGEGLPDPFRPIGKKPGPVKRDPADAANTPRTVPPGADTQRRVRAALLQARESVEDGTVPRAAPIAPATPSPPRSAPKDSAPAAPSPPRLASKDSASAAPSSPRPAPKDNPSAARPQPPSARKESACAAPTPDPDPDSAPVTLPSAYPGFQPEESASNAVHGRASFPRRRLAASGILVGVALALVTIGLRPAGPVTIARSAALGSIMGPTRTPPIEQPSEQTAPINREPTDVLAPTTPTEQPESRPRRPSPGSTRRPPRPETPPPTQPPTRPMASATPSTNSHDRCKSDFFCDEH